MPSVSWVGLPLLSVVLAFFVGALTTYFDCYSTLAARVGRVPYLFVFNPFVIGLAAVCGMIAGLMCWFSAQNPDGMASTVLALKAEDPYRGLVVGASVLVLIRSKLFHLKDSPIGGEFLYLRGLEAALEDVSNRWTIIRSQFQHRNVLAALQDANFAVNIGNVMATALAGRPPATRVRFNAALKAVTNKRPRVSFAIGDPTWNTYYRALIGVALDTCGPTVVRQAFPSFT